MDGPPLLHVDADAFFASVELRDDPRLRGRPMAVADTVVMCASYEARRAGVRAGTSTQAALRICPGLVTVRPRPQAYSEASAELFRVLGEVARTIEPGSMEEAFLDVPDLPWERAEGAATGLRSLLRREVGLPVSVGVGRTKLIAKLASRAAKPDGYRVITPREEAELRPGLQLAELWGVGPRTLDKLQAAGLGTVADLATLSREQLCAVAGTTMGRRLHAISTGTDDATVRPPGPRRSASASTTTRVTGPRQARAILERLAERLSDRLRAEDLACTRLALTSGSGERLAATTLDRPTADPADLTRTAHALLDLAAPTATIPGIAISATGLTPVAGPRPASPD